MLIENAIFRGVSSFDSKKTGSVFYNLSFEIPSGSNQIGKNFQGYLMDASKSDLKLEDFEKYLNKPCLIDISKNFCNKIIFR